MNNKELDKKKKNNNVLLIILSILGVLIVLGIFGYSYFKNREENAEGTQGEVTREKKEETKEGDEQESKGDKKKTKKTEEKTKDWQVYENKQYKYKFKYPENWYASSENEEDSWIVSFTNERVERTEEINLLEGVEVEILVQGNPRSLSLEEWVAEGHIFTGDPKNSQEIKISGIKAIKEEVDFEGMTTTVYFFYNNDVYTISYSGIETGYNRNKGIFDLMIESFEIG